VYVVRYSIMKYRARYSIVQYGLVDDFGDLRREQIKTGKRKTDRVMSSMLEWLR
jgi:hypothetical protein